MTPFTQNIKLCRFTAFSLCLLIVGITTGGAVGVVWLRQGVARHASATQELETKIEQAERRSAALEARIAKAHSPQYLTARAPDGLRPTQSNQIVWMPRAQLLSPVDYQDPTLPTAIEAPAVDSPVAAPSPVQAVVAASGAPRAPVQGQRFLAQVTPESAPAVAEPSTPQLITFDLALSTVNETAGRSRNQ